jgi:hypothetical protein
VVQVEEDQKKSPRYHLEELPLPPELQPYLGETGRQLLSSNLDGAACTCPYEPTLPIHKQPHSSTPCHLQSALNTSMPRSPSLTIMAPPSLAARSCRHAGGPGPRACGTPTSAMKAAFPSPQPQILKQIGRTKPADATLGIFFEAMRVRTGKPVPADVIAIMTMLDSQGPRSTSAHSLIDLMFIACRALHACIDAIHPLHSTPQPPPGQCMPFTGMRGCVVILGCLTFAVNSRLRTRVLRNTIRPLSGYEMGEYWGRSPPKAIVSHQVGTPGDRNNKWLAFKWWGWYHWRAMELAVEAGIAQGPYLASRHQEVKKVLAYAPSVDLNLTAHQFSMAVLSLVEVSE